MKKEMQSSETFNQVIFMGSFLSIYRDHDRDLGTDSDNVQFSQPKDVNTHTLVRCEALVNLWSYKYREMPNGTIRKVVRYDNINHDMKAWVFNRFTLTYSHTTNNIFVFYGGLESRDLDVIDVTESRKEEVLATIEKHLLTGR
jgi:hypothetical protein